MFVCVRACALRSVHVIALWTLDLCACALRSCALRSVRVAFCARYTLRVFCLSVKIHKRTLVPVCSVDGHLITVVLFLLAWGRPHVLNSGVRGTLPRAFGLNSITVCCVV